jgi:hypothetical protein
MNSKNIILLGLCIIGLCAWEAQAVNLNHSSIINVEYNLPTDFETFELHGDLLLGVGPNAISAGYSRNAVCVHFSQSFGSVSVALHNEEGVLVYSTVVNTNVQQTLIIPIANNNGNGDYYLTLDNANGFAEGDFRRN